MKMLKLKIILQERKTKMIYGEKQLEDYICNNQEIFIKKLQEIFNIKEKINFVGRQVYIGKNNIADLIYNYEFKDEVGMIFKNFIIVELKYRNLETRDLAQISRYITTLEEKALELENKNSEINVYGVLLGFDLDENMKEIQIYLDFIDDNTIKFITIENEFVYNNPTYSHNNSYIENLKLDDRILDVINE